MRKSLFLAFAILLAGCATKERIVVQRVSVVIPMECQEKAPEPPVMPTEQLRSGDDIYSVTKAALAEIDIRIAYEKRLNAALNACIAPISK